MINEIYIALGSVFFGSLIMGLYNKLNGNGNARVAKLEVKIESLEREVKEMRILLNEIVKNCIVERVRA